LDVLKTIGHSKIERGQKTQEQNIKNLDTKKDIKKYYNEVFYKLV